MNESDWAVSAIALSPWIVLAFFAGYGLRLLQFGRRPSPVQMEAEPVPPAATPMAEPTPTEPASPPEPVPASATPLAYQTLILQERFKSGFLARTAHELRSPINSMVGLHQLILEDLCEGPEEEREFIGQARDSAMKLLQRLDTLIAASKLDSGREQPKFAPVAVAEVFRVVENLTLLQAANHNLRLTVTLPDEAVSVRADGRWLRTLLVSLLEDAITNTASGFVKLWCEPGKTPDPTALYLASDRPVTGLIEARETAAAQIGQCEDVSSDIPSDTEPSSAATVQFPSPIQLSTALVLSTAQLMLPPMAGELAVLPDEDGGSVLKISLPTA